MNKKIVVLVFVFLTIVIGAFIVYKIWNKPFKDPLKGGAIKVTATQLFSDFATNETSAQKKYVPETVGGKIVEVTGEIKEIGKNTDGETYYVLKTNDEVFGVKCVMDKGYEMSAKSGDVISIRGFCDGLNSDVIINRCRVEK